MGSELSTQHSELSTGGRRGAICLVSGGLDSAVAAAVARGEEYDPRFLFVDYGQRTREKELWCARQLAAHFGASEIRCTRLDWLAEISRAPLTTSGELLTADRPERIYVPFRNTLLLALAVAWAEVVEATAVFIGSIGPPWATPDNSPAYLHAFQQLMRIGTRLGERIEVRAPLCDSSKAEVVEKGRQLGVPFELTWSCQNFEDAACGLCTGCWDRLRAFEELAMKDPVAYRPRDPSSALGGS